LARKILLADDSVTAQNMGRKILADAGYDVVTVNNGSAALKRITEIKPDLIVLDVYMPGYSGLEVCQRIKDAAETEHIPVLLTVGKLEPFKPEEARRVRADGHIVKPFEASELLTAITRLEDRMVPQQSDGRFGTSVSGVERFGGDSGGRKAESTDADTGWKSRLRFPSKKKKEEPEPEPEDVAAATPFREFRKAKGKSAASTSFAVKAPPPPGQEPGLVPDIPRDITPAELDALSALAAKLDGPIPAAENIVPLAEATPAAQSASDRTNPNAAPVERISPETADAEVPKTYAEILAAVAEAKKEKENNAEVERPLPAVESAAAPVEAPAALIASAVESGVPSEVEIPVKRVELAIEAAAVAEPAPISPGAQDSVIAPSQIQPTETQPELPVAAVTDNTSFLSQDPAPVDRHGEPMFTTAANAIEQLAIASANAQEKAEPRALEAVAQEKITASAPEPTAIANPEENRAQPSRTQHSKAEEPRAQEKAHAEPLPTAAAQTEKSPAERSKPEAEQPAPVAASALQSAAAEELSPTDAELAQALRLLTPAGGNSGSAIIPSQGTLVAAGQLLAEEALRNAGSGPRWVAQPVALSPEEASISLEAEMFRAFMTVSPSAVASLDPARMTGVSAIEAAVESRLAAAELAGAKASADQAPEQASSAPLPEVAAAEASAKVTQTISTEASSQTETSEPEKIKAEAIDTAKAEPEKTEVETIKAETKEAETKDSPARIAEEAPAASAVASSQSAIESAVQPDELPASSTTTPAIAAVAEENQDSSSEVGSEESMAKDIKSKSNWHQIRTAAAGAAPGTNLVEAAKQAESASEESPKAMAAAAAEGSSASAPDAGTIASIVDSVMADLRPKIVEEIAKKLAGK
jgi:CheY-like chemotaxis protein